MTHSDIIAICAVLLTAFGLYQTYRLSNLMAIRNEDKILLDELLDTIKEIDTIAAQFFLAYNKDKQSPKLYISRITSQSSIAQYLAFELKKTRKILTEDIDIPLSNLHYYATINIENKALHQRKDELIQQYTGVNKAYLDSVRIIHQAFHKKYIK